MTVRALPDVESLIVQYLAAHDDVVAALAGGRVSGELPPKSSGLALTVLLLGGQPRIDWHLTAAQVQVDAWGGAREATRNLATIAVGALTDLVGVTDAGVVSGVKIIDGLRRIDDPGGRPRYSFDAQVFAHPIP